MSKYSQQFLDKIKNKFTRIDLEPPHQLSLDGQIYRCRTTTHPDKHNGSYFGYSGGDGFPLYLVCNNWETGKKATWRRSLASGTDAKEKEKLTAALEEAEALALKEKERLAGLAKIKAKRLYKKASHIEGHPYLEKKGVPPAPLLKAFKGALVVPVHNSAGDLLSLQFIDNGGNKRFLKGGSKAGGFFHIKGKKKDTTVLIAEGLATGISAHMATGFEAFVAFDAGNLVRVAGAVRERYPEHKIIICADNDINLNGYNIGVDKASEAALLVGGFVAIPKLKKGGKYVKCDFNDIYTKKHGLHRVRKQIQNAERPIGYQTLNDTLPEGFSLERFGKKTGLYFTEHKKDKKPKKSGWGRPFMFWRILAMKTVMTGGSILLGRTLMESGILGPCLPLF